MKTSVEVCGPDVDMILTIKEPVQVQSGAQQDLRLKEAAALVGQLLDGIQQCQAYYNRGLRPEYRPKIMILGHGRAGKDEAATILESLTGLSNARSSSVYLAPVVAATLGLTVEEAFNRRHEMRDLWYAEGKRVRLTDPGFLVRQCYANGEIAVGFRELCEVQYVVANGTVDHILWIERCVDQDPTLEFSLSDISLLLTQYQSSITLDVVSNHGTLTDLEKSLARWWKLKLAEKVC